MWLSPLTDISVQLVSPSVCRRRSYRSAPGASSHSAVTANGESAVRVRPWMACSIRSRTLGSRVDGPERPPSGTMTPPGFRVVVATPTIPGHVRESIQCGSASVMGNRDTETRESLVIYREVHELSLWNTGLRAVALSRQVIDLSREYAVVESRSSRCVSLMRFPTRPRTRARAACLRPRTRDTTYSPLLVFNQRTRLPHTGSRDALSMPTENCTLREESSTAEDEDPLRVGLKADRSGG